MIVRIAYDYAYSLRFGVHFRSGYNCHFAFKRVILWTEQSGFGIDLLTPHNLCPSPFRNIFAFLQKSFRPDYKVVHKSIIIIIIITKNSTRKIKKKFFFQ